jgi:glycosyltransferase involved in cell wall biosynthesis
MLLSNSYNPDDRVRNEALALKEAGYEVFILAWDRECKRPELENVDGIEVRRARINAEYEQGAKQGVNILQLWRWFVKANGKLQPQVVHCHDFDTFPAGVWYQLKNRSVKLVLDAHESYFMMMKPTVPGIVAWVIGILERLLTWRAQLLISACEATSNYYRNRGAIKAVVVGNWKNPENYRFDLDVITCKRRELGIGNRLVVAYIGDLSVKRNVLPLLQTIRERPWLFLILGGRGGQEETIRIACSGLENVYFPGYISPNDVPLLTAVADVIYYGLNPSHIYASFNAPNKLYEALAAGKTMLSTDLGGELSDVVRSTQCGILISQADTDKIGAAIDILSQDTVRCAMQRRAAQAGLTTYNWLVAKQRLLSAYSKLMRHS